MVIFLILLTVIISFALYFTALTEKSPKKKGKKNSIKYILPVLVEAEELEAFSNEANSGKYKSLFFPMNAADLDNMVLIYPIVKNEENLDKLKKINFPFEISVFQDAIKTFENADGDLNSPENSEKKLIDVEKPVVMLEVNIDYYDVLNFGSFVADFSPFIGNIKAAYEVVVGKNPITGREISDLERGALLVAVFIPVAGVAKVGISALKQINKIAHGSISVKTLLPAGYKDAIEIFRNTKWAETLQQLKYGYKHAMFDQAPRIPRYSLYFLRLFLRDVRIHEPENVKIIKSGNMDEAFALAFAEVKDIEGIGYVNNYTDFSEIKKLAEENPNFSALARYLEYEKLLEKEWTWKRIYVFDGVTKREEGNLHSVDNYYTKVIREQKGQEGDSYFVVDSIKYTNEFDNKYIEVTRGDKHYSFK